MDFMAVITELDLEGSLFDNGSQMTYPSNRLNAITIITGQTKVMSLVIRTRDGRPFKLIDTKIILSIRRGGEDTPLLIQKTTSDGIEITDAAKGQAKITLSSEDTKVIIGQTYRYDVWVEIAGTPPIRHPVIVYGEIRGVDRVTSFPD